MAGQNTNLQSIQRNPSNDEFDFLDDPIEFDDDDLISQSQLKTTPVTASISTPPVIIKRPGGGHTIIVSGRQRGNPILGHIRNVRWEYGEIVPDYVVGQTSCVLFLSLRYHRLHPEYIYSRVQALGCKIALLLRQGLHRYSQESHQESIRELTKLSVTNELTLIVAWSAEEAGRYLETYKALEHKPPDLIMEKVENDYLSRLNDYLTRARGVNQTDVLTLASNFGSLKNIMNASAEQLAICPGFGEQKIKYLTDAFHKPFVIKKKK